jgi:hypothetical protein
MWQPLIVSTVFAAIGIVASAALRPIWWMIWIQILPSSYTVPSWFNPTPLLIFLTDFPIAAIVGTSIGNVARTDRPVLWGLYGGALLVLGSGLVTGRLTLREDADGWAFFWTYLPAVIIASVALLTAEKANMHERRRKDVA